MPAGERGDGDCGFGVSAGGTGYQGSVVAAVDVDFRTEIAVGNGADSECVFTVKV